MLFLNSGNVELDLTTLDKEFHTMLPRNTNEFVP